MISHLAGTATTACLRDCLSHLDAYGRRAHLRDLDARLCKSVLEVLGATSWYVRLPLSCLAPLYGLVYLASGRRIGVMRRLPLYGSYAKFVRSVALLHLFDIPAPAQGGSP